MTVATETACASWYSVVGNSDYYWRCTAPAKVIGAKWVPIPEDGGPEGSGAGGFFAVTQPNEDTAFPWQLEPQPFYPTVEGSAVVWTRPDPTRSIHALAMKEYHGVRTVAEVDDNYLSDTKFNIYMKSNGFGPKEREQHLKAVASMDAAIFTTTWLKDTYRQAIRKTFPNMPHPDMFVCGNHLFLEDWPERIEQDGPLRVGWMGSASHLWDVDHIWGAMMHAGLEGCERVMIGFNPAEPEHPVETKKSLFKTQQWRKAVDRFVPWVKLDGTSRLSLPLDIGFCPLLYNDFTLGKSDIKAVETTISGAAVIAQNHPVYNRNWTHEETCLLAGSPAEFVDCLRRLIKDSVLRRELVENAQAYVREERNIETHAGEWREAVLG